MSRVILKSKIPKLLKQFPGALDARLMKAGFFVEAEAKQRTPVDFGRLRASITTKSSKNESHTYTADGKTFDGALADRVRPGTVIVGTNVEYAVPVHENLTARHEVGQAKFLENAITENAGQIKAIIRDGVRQAIAEAAD
jgi:hypothetical protein